MFKNRFLLVIGLVSLLLVTMAVSRPFTNTSAPNAVGANDFYQRHPHWARNAEASDYYARHSQRNASAPVTIDLAGDFFQRHTAWASEIQNIAIPLTGVSLSSDYFQRHPELSAPVIIVDLTDFFVRHPEMRTPATTDLSDYFLRH